MGSSPTRGSSFFLGKVTALGVLCCLALLFVCFFLPSFSSLIKTCTVLRVCVEFLQVLNSGMRYLSDFLFLGSSSLIAACGDTHDNKSVISI